MVIYSINKIDLVIKYLILLMLLAMSVNCFAAGASKDFAAEETAADAFVGSLLGSSVSYEQASKGFSAGLKQNLPADKFAELKKTIPAGRFGQPEEVAALVSFLCSDEAAYITGQVIEIAGGIG